MGRTASKAGKSRGGAKKVTEFGATTEKYGLNKIEMDDLNSMLKSMVEHRWPEDGGEFYGKMKPKTRDILESDIKKYFKDNLGWDMDVAVTLHTEFGSRGRLRGGERRSRTTYTKVDIKKKK